MIVQVVFVVMSHAIHRGHLLILDPPCHPSSRHLSRSRSSRLIVIRMMMREVWTRMRRMQRMDLQLIHLSIHPSHSILSPPVTVTLTLTLPFITTTINIDIGIDVILP